MDDGFSVITDRYYFSSYAYHSVDMDMDWVIQSNCISADILRPDLNVYIDVSPEASVEDSIPKKAEHPPGDEYVPHNINLIS